MVSSLRACLHPFASVTTQPSDCMCFVLCLTNFLDSSTMSTRRPSKGGRVGMGGESGEGEVSVEAAAARRWLGERDFSDWTPPLPLMRTEGDTRRSMSLSLSLFAALSFSLAMAVKS